MLARARQTRSIRVGLAAVACAVAGLTAPAVGVPTSDAATQAVQPAVSGCPGGATVACYPMEERSFARRYDLVDRVDPSTNSVIGAIDPQSSSGVVADRGALTYSFAGWGRFVQRSGARWRLAPDPVTGATTFDAGFGQVVVDRSGILDPATSYNPGLRDWRVKARVEPVLLTNGDGTTSLPDPCAGTGCSDLARPSYNLVQKGRNAPGGAIGGFYKIELMGYAGVDHGLSFVKGSVHCVYEDDDGTNVEAFSGVGAGAVVMDHPTYYTLECVRVGSTVRLKVTDDLTGAVQQVPGTMTVLGRRSVQWPSGDGVLDDVSPANVGGTAYSPFLAIGKKPFSTNPADSFRGWIDYLSLSTL